MNNRLHNYLDHIISSVIEYDIPYYLEESGLDCFEDIDIEVLKHDYFNDDLICIAIFGVDGFKNEIHFQTIVIRTEDVKNEFENNIQSVCNYLYKPLKKRNDELLDEYEETI